ncbi:CBS domain-containing protein [Streptomyces sp. NPDC056159]|uniref:CBS domain-containing protein n=1 Tax=Streptomyces sp. NPDC056159 TaxID=3155537 RepID=UPI003437A5B4
MTSAADLMRPGARWIPATEALDPAAQLMRELNVGALPVSDPNDANERGCGTRHRRRAVHGTPRGIRTDAGVGDVLQQMQTHQIRCLPVIDENKRLVGMISKHDLARSLTDDQIAQFMERIYA